MLITIFIFKKIKGNYAPFSESLASDYENVYPPNLAGIDDLIYWAYVMCPKSYGYQENSLLKLQDTERDLH